MCLTRKLKKVKSVLVARVGINYFRVLCFLIAWVCSPFVSAGDNVSYTTHFSRVGEPSQTDIYFLNGWRTGMLESAFRNQEGLRSARIEIHSMDRHITLSGYVDTVAAKMLAEEIALSIQGVDHVINDLLVYQSGAGGSAEQIKQQLEDAGGERSKHISKIIADNEISTLVKTKLLSNQTTRNVDVNIVVDGDKVILIGKVASQTESDLIFYMTHNTHGVREVVNKLVVVSNS